LECVPNFNEGCDLKKNEKIVEPFRGKEGVGVEDFSMNQVLEYRIYE